MNTALLFPRRRMRPVFQKVSNDPYRLVIAQADTITELAQILGVDQSTLSHAFKKLERGITKDSCYQITWITLEDGEE